MKSQSGKMPGVELSGHFVAVDPRGAKFFEWCFGAATDRDAGVLQNLEARIEDRAFQRAQIRRRRNPARAGALVEIVAMPILHGDDVQIAIDVIFGR